jgi:peptidoglycan pentaglycine glycine transferase (the first glycine)
MREDECRRQESEAVNKWKTWDEFLESKANSEFRQSSLYASFKAPYNGWTYFGTVFRDADNIVGGAVVFRRNFGSEKTYYYIPDGPVLLQSDSISDQEQVFNAVMEFIEAKRQDDERVVSHLCINPRWEQVPAFVTGFQPASHYYGLPRDTQLIDLHVSETEILAQMKPKGRYNVRIARRHGVSIVEDCSSHGIAEFVSICRETFARKNLGETDAEYFQTLIPILSASGHASVLFAEYEGKKLATALVVYFGHTATYYYGGSRAIHRNVMAPYLLHFDIMCKAKARGCRHYDLFGVAPQGAQDDRWTDISVFKRKLGGREVRFVPTLEYVYDPVAYQQWQAGQQERRKERHARRVEHEVASGVAG